jgi:hypothetical protein
VDFFIIRINFFKHFFITEIVEIHLRNKFRCGFSIGFLLYTYNKGSTVQVEAKSQGGGYFSWFWGSKQPAAADSSDKTTSELRQLDQALTQEEKQRLYEAIGYQVLYSTWVLRENSGFTSSQMLLKTVIITGVFLLLSLWAHRNRYRFIQLSLWLNRNRYRSGLINRNRYS